MTPDGWGMEGQLTPLKFRAEVINCIWHLCYFCVAS